jgi:site-specific recombinase
MGEEKTLKMVRWFCVITGVFLVSFSLAYGFAVNQLNLFYSFVVIPVMMGIAILVGQAHVKLMFQFMDRKNGKKLTTDTKDKKVD